MEGQTSTASENDTKNEENIVFVSHDTDVRQEYDSAKRLYEELKRTKLHPWLDQYDILPGQRRETEMLKAIKNSRYFIAILSSNSINRKGPAQKQREKAFNVQTNFPPSDIFLIPARLDNCTVSDERLEDIQYVDLFPDWDSGFKRILQAMKVEETRPAKVIPFRLLILMPFPVR